MTSPDTLDAAYFDGVFASDDDPWSLSTSPYEAAKFDSTIRAIDDRRYAAALEVGCAQGELTRRLAPLCDRLLAIDIAQRAVERTRGRLGALPNVQIDRADFTAGPTIATRFDLILLSEVVYYWSDADIAAAALWLRAHVRPGARLLLVHWTGATDYPQTGDGAVAGLHGHLVDTIDVERSERTDAYRLDLWRIR